MAASSSFFLLAVHFVLIMLQTLNSDAFICDGEKGMVEAVIFTDLSSQFNEPYNLLYFEDASLAVHCQLRNRSNDNPNTRNTLVNQYSAQGMPPTVTFITLDWSKSYKFDELIEGENVFWMLNISKHELLEEYEESNGGKIPWTFKVELGQGLNLFESWGTVVMPDKEPLLSVELGDHITELNKIPSPVDVIVWQHPCSPGVAVLAPVFDGKQTFKGSFVAVTHGSFTLNSTQWYDLLRLSSGHPDNYSICKELSFANCEKLSILDFTLVDNYILLVTTKGLIRSESMGEVGQGVNKTKLKFYQVSKIHSTIDQAFNDGTVERSRIKLYHTAQCDGHEVSIIEHVTHLIYTPADGERSILLSSEPPFDEWSSFEFPDSLKEFSVLGVAWDIQRNTMVLLLKDSNKVRSLVAVLDPQTSQLLQPVFRFPENVSFTKITFHAHTHVIFVYGSQVWLSLDGGNSFDKVLDTHLRGDSVSSLFANSLGDAFVLITSHGAVYSGWSGILRVSQIEPATSNSNCSFKIANFQHQTSVNIICIQNTSSLLTFKTYSIDLDSQIRVDRTVLFRPLLVNFVSEREVEFVAFCGDAFFSDPIGCSDSFQQSDVGRVLRTRNGGSALITGVQRSTDSNDFSARVTGLIIKPIAPVDKSDSPALHYTLHVNITGSYAHLELHNSVNDSGWQGEDIGKTVRLSSGISVILTACKSLSFATGRLPVSWNDTRTYVGVYEEETWFLIDLRPFYAFRPTGSPILHVRQTDIDGALAEVGDEQQFSFSSENVGDVLKYGRGLGLISSLVTVASVDMTPVSIMKSHNLIPGNYTENWGVYKAEVNNDSYIPYIPNPQFQGWWMAEDECQHFLVEDPPSRLEQYHLDSSESLSFTLRAISKAIADEKPTKPLLRVYIGNTLLFYVESSYQYSNMNHTLQVTLTKRPFISGISSISVRLHQTASLLCKEASYTVHGGCPPTKKLRFLYPLSYSLENFLNAEVTDSKGIVRNLKLPFNYRAPSPRGKAIPMSKNAYNVDPQKSLYKTTYAITRSSLRYKQCKGKDRRSDCGCTNQMRGSSLVKHSDCIDTVYRMMFSETLTPRFVVIQEDREEEPIRFPFYLEELNQRKDFTILSPSDLTFSGISSLVLKQDLNSSIQFEGSGLYHFRTRVVQENYTFCSLTDEFMVFVVDTPLPFPVNDVVRACTGMGFASLLFFVYTRYFHGKKKMKND